MAILPDDLGKKLNAQIAVARKEVSDKETNTLQQENSSKYVSEVKAVRHQHLAFFSLAGVLGC